MDGTEIGVFKQPHQVCLRSLLQRKNCMALETQIRLHTQHHTTQQDAVRKTTTFIQIIMNDKGKSNPSSTLTLKSWAISRTSLWNGSFLISSSVLFWYLRISLQRTSRPLIKQGNKRPTNKKNRKYVSYRRATVPGRYRWGFFTPPVVGADFRAAWKTQCQLIWIWQE